MNWAQLKKIYEERITQLTPVSHKKAKRGIADLEETLRIFYPDALADPYLLINMEWFNLYTSISTWQLSNDGVWAIRRLRTIFENVPDFSKIALDIHTGRLAFTKDQVMFCAAHWLKNNGWILSEPVQYQPGEADIFAEKDGIQFIAVGVGSVDQPKRMKYTGIYVAPSTFKQIVGRGLFILMEQMNKHENILPAILIADDAATREMAMQYATHIKKMGIAMYMVKSIDEVVSE